MKNGQSLKLCILICLIYVCTCCLVDINHLRLLSCSAVYDFRSSTTMHLSCSWSNVISEYQMHLCCVSEIYSSDASSAQVDIQMPNDLSDSSKDVRLKVFVQQIGRRIDDEYNVGLLTTLNDRFCRKLNEKQ